MSDGKTWWSRIWPSLLFVLVFALLFGLFVRGASAAPQDAVVRMISHGGSATVIYVGGGRSLLLSCGHCFRGSDRYKKIVIDAQSPNPSGPLKAPPRLIKVNYEDDLSLIEVPTELPYVAQVAPPGHRPGRLVSAGYDEMKWPATQRSATMLGSQGNLTYTRERPWHGRSGGGLLDVDHGYLVGVVQGYEVTGQQRGMYASHTAIARFLGWPATPAAQSPAPYAGQQQFGRPYVTEQRQQMTPCPGCPGGVCPPGACPGGICSPGVCRPGGT